MAPQDRKAVEPEGPSKADTELAIMAANDAASHALHAGVKAPLFTLPDATGEPVALEDLLHAGPVVLHFIRGAWCSFSEQSLSDFSETHREVESLGASAVAISPASPTASTLSSLPVRELRDSDMRVARHFGLAFTLPPGLRPRYEGFGYRPPAPRDGGDWLVPIPATYLLDREGTIVLAIVDADYRNLFDRTSLITALKTIPSRRTARPGSVARD